MARIAFQQVTIVGLGLLGSSLGLALKRLSPAPRVIGCDLSGDARREANGKKAVDRATSNVLDAVQGSDLVVLAVPVRAIAVWFFPSRRSRPNPRCSTRGLPSGAGMPSRRSSCKRLAFTPPWSRILLCTWTMSWRSSRRASVHSMSGVLREETLRPSITTSTPDAHRRI